jgi:F0F1-type ATP synthase membrane subunit c/vacuolar-type H+-ATPase subunit K
MTVRSVSRQNLPMGLGVRIIQIGMLVSVALYAVVGESLHLGTKPIPSNTLFHALSLISITLVGATMVVRRTLIVPSEAALRQRPDDPAALARWRTAYIFLYALCEVLGLFGIVLRLTGFTFANVWGFYLGGFLLLLLNSPRQPSAELR